MNLKEARDNCEKFYKLLIPISPTSSDYKIGKSEGFLEGYEQGIKDATDSALQQLIENIKTKLSNEIKQ